MNRLNADGHDESQYLPKVFDPVTGKMIPTPPVNAFRAQHGNVVYEGDLIRQLEWLPDILYAHAVIDKCHLDTALSFYTAYIETMKALKIGDIKGILNDKTDELSTPKGDIFFAVMHGLCKPEANMMLWLVCDDRNRKNTLLARHLIGTIKHALENSQIIIDNLKKKNNNTLSPEPESRPESARKDIP